MAEVLHIKGHKDYERSTKRSVAGCLRQVRERLKPTWRWKPETPWYLGVFADPEDFRRRWLERLPDRTA